MRGAAQAVVGEPAAGMTAHKEDGVCADTPPAGTGGRSARVIGRPTPDAPSVSAQICPRASAR